MPDHEILELAKTLRYDLTAMQAKVSELLRMAAQLPAPDPRESTCPSCGLHHLGGPNTLAEHQYTMHDGPEPQHWLQAEQLAAPDTTRPSLPPGSGNASTTSQIALLKDHTTKETNA